MTQIPTRRCHICGIEQPLTAEFFQRAPYFAQGFSFYCNTCDAESRTRKKVALKKFEVDFIHNEHGSDSEKK